MAYGLIFLVIAAAIVAAVLVRRHSWQETTARNYRRDRAREAKRRQERAEDE